MSVIIMPLAPGNVIQKFVTMLWRWWGRRELKRKWQKQNVGGVAVIHMRLLLTEVVRYTSITELGAKWFSQSHFFICRLQFACRNPRGILRHVHVQHVAYGTAGGICIVSICIHLRHKTCWVIGKTQGEEPKTRKMTKAGVTISCRNNWLHIIIEMIWSFRRKLWL